MDDQEIQGPDKVSKTWIKNLSSVVNKTKNTKASMIYMKPKDAIKLGIVELNKSETNPNEKMLPEHDRYRYQHQPGEQHGDKKIRATDFIQSINMYSFNQTVIKPENLVLHFLQGGPDKAFVHEQLMRIAEYT